MSGWSGGSTRSWRRVRLYVLQRDRWRCQVPVAHYTRAGVRLDPGHVLTSHDRRLPTHGTAGHVAGNRRDAGGTDDPDQLRAECAAWNYADGARYGNAKRAGPARSWTW